MGFKCSPLRKNELKIFGQKSPLASLRKPHCVPAFEVLHCCLSESSEASIRSLQKTVQEVYYENTVQDLSSWYAKINLGLTSIFHEPFKVPL